MKKLMLLSVMLIAVLFTSCKKERKINESNIFNIPRNKTFSTVDLQGDSVTVEIARTDGYWEKFNTTVRIEFDTASNQFIATINPPASLNSKLWFIQVVIIKSATPFSYDLFAIKPMFHEAMVTNGNADAPTGVDENEKTITLTANNIYDQEYETVCVKIEITK